MDAEKATKRFELTAMTSELLDSYCGAINDRLKAFGADFEVAKFTKSDAGGTPRAAYALRLMGEDIPLTADGAKPSFSTTLSEGDRRLLGLCFFLASLDNDAGIAESTVVIDDPVCSFDIYRRSKMVEAIGQLVDRSAQVIVLSHDADFIRMLRDAGFDMIRELHRAGRYCVFDECNIDAVCESEYVANYRELAGYLAEGRPEGELRGIAKRVRPYLETNLHHRFPIEFAAAENLGKMIGAIKNRSATSPLSCLDGEIGDLEQVNEYSSPCHHDEGPKPMDRELQEIVELALTLGRN
jgi:wobble nucleotide-excising tRNase